MAGRLVGPWQVLGERDLAAAHCGRLAPFGILVGKVVDEKGQPVRGARIRVGALPEEVLAARIYDVRATSLLAISDMLRSGQQSAVIEPPAWLRAHLDSLPVPTTRSGPDGSFRLEGVPLGRVVGGVDLLGYVGIPIGPIQIEDGEHDLGILTLTRGRKLQGLVLDAAGEPAAGLEVFAGAELPIGDVALLDPCGKTDAKGRFSLTGVPLQGQAVAIARSRRARGL